MVIANFAMPAHAHAQSGLSGTQGLVLGGALGFVTGRLMAPQAVIIQPGNYQIISIPMVPNLTAPRVYNLRGGPPHPDARPLYQEGTEILKLLIR